MNGLNPQIPLTAAQQPSLAQTVGETYQLAGAIEKQREVQQQRQDQQAIQQYLKEGGNLETPEGLAKASEWAKSNLSPGGYQTVVQAGQEMKLNEAKMLEHYAKADESALAAYQQKLDFMGRNLSVPIDAYEEAKKNGKSEEEALLAFENGKAQVNQQIESIPTASGQPAIPQALRDAFGKMSIQEAKSKFATVKYNQENLMAAAKLRHQEAQTELVKQETKTSQALEQQRRQKPAAGSLGIPEEITQSNLHGQEFLKLLPPGEAAEVLAIAEGRKSLNDVPAKDGRRGRIGQFVSQFDPGFSNIRNPADKAAAVAISKDISAIRPYIDMLDKNADIAVELSKKAIATDSRLANKSINWLRQNMSDNPDVAEFLAQTTFVQTEAARVLNNPRLVGQLTDSAREEMQHVLSGDMPLKSYERVIRRIQKDGLNRFEAMENQRDRLFAGSVAPKEVPKSELKPTAGEKQPAGGDILSILKKHGVK